jgi:hypothetical protein
MSEPCANCQHDCGVQAEQAIEDHKRWEWRSALLSVAALAVAAVEAYDRRSDV